MQTKLIQTKDYLLLIDEEAEIKIGDYILEKESIINIFPDYLTDLDECKKIIAYFPLTKEAKELDLPELPPFEEIDIEKLAEENNKLIAMYKNDTGLAKSIYMSAIKNFKDGYKAAQSKQFSLEDMEAAVAFGITLERLKNDPNKLSDEEEMKGFIQSLSTQQLPKEFIPEYEYIHDETVPFPKTKEGKATIKIITNSEGKKMLLGTYKY